MFCKKKRKDQQDRNFGMRKIEKSKLKIKN